MNTRIKGQKAENEYKKKLEADGWIVEQVKGSTKFNKSVDFFGIADLIALSANGIRLIQVKSNSTAGALKKLKEWSYTNNGFLPPNLSLCVAVRYDGAGGKPATWKVTEII